MGLKTTKEATQMLNIDQKLDIIIHLINECESELPNSYAGDKEFEKYVQSLDDTAREWKSFREKRQLMLDRQEISDPEEVA